MLKEFDQHPDTERINNATLLLDEALLLNRNLGFLKAKEEEIPGLIDPNNALSRARKIIEIEEKYPSNYLDTSNDNGFNKAKVDPEDLYFARSGFRAFFMRLRMEYSAIKSGWANTGTIDMIRGGEIQYIGEWFSQKVADGEISTSFNGIEQTKRTLVGLQSVRMVVDPFEGLRRPMDLVNKLNKIRS